MDETLEKTSGMADKDLEVTSTLADEALEMMLGWDGNTEEELA